MTTRIPNSVAVWREAPGTDASVALSRVYWAFDAGTSTWTLTTDRNAEAGRLVDLTGTGTFTLELLAAVTPSAPVLASTRRPDGTVLVY